MINLAHIQNGLGESKVVQKHAVRYTPAAPLSYPGTIFPGLLASSASANTVFSIKGPVSWPLRPHWPATSRSSRP